MKMPIAALVIIAVIVAIAAGWIYQAGTPASQSDLEIPSDIDYFLTTVNYRSMNRLGHLDYEMQSPYLEHLTVANISLIEQPVMQIYRDADNWHIEAFKGKLFHEQDSLQLSQNIIMRRLGGNPLLVRAEEMLFQPELNRISAKEQVGMEFNNARIHGSEAIFDLKNKVYSLKNTRASYYREQGLVQIRPVE